jgi:hypothetical protein
MRVVLLAVLCLTGCASEKLDQAPPAGVDLTGRWTLNQADSDDPQRLLQAQLNTPAHNQSSGGSGGSGRSGRQGGGGMAPGGTMGPVMPSASVMSDGLRWPGKQLEIKQVAGVVAFTSDGINRVCQPMGDMGKAHGHHPPEGGPPGGGPAGRDSPRGRDVPPPRCGWTDKTLIVQGGDPDEDRPPFEEHYSLSEDRNRLIETVDFKGGQSSGFTMSRVWDRAK